MNNIQIWCKSCNKEIEGDTARVISCGCSNMATIRYNNKITAFDLSNIVIVNSLKTSKKTGVLTNEDIAWQEARKLRKFRKLDFEVR